MSSSKPEPRIYTAEEAKALRKAASKGPWRVDHMTGTSIWIRREDGAEANVPVAHLGANHPSRIQQPNAALLAAAPDLAYTVEHLSAKLATAEAWLKAEAGDVDYVARLQAKLNCAEGRMIREGWEKSDGGYQWVNVGPDAGLDAIVKVHRGMRNPRSKTWIMAYVECIDFRTTPMTHHPRIEADTMLEAIEAAEGWLRAEGLLPKEIE